ncbi:MAG: Bacterial type secretion system protein domain protein [Planctomycetota bacterium]|nr:Bacterial type secretion system protein domain protein [Planctomycetota bacterium]
MSSDLVPAVVVFVMVVSLVAIFGLLLSGRKGKLDARLDAMAGRGRPEDRPETVVTIARSALPKMGKVIVPEDEAERTRLRARLVHAGLYQRQAMHVFLGVKLALLIVATVIGVGLTLAEVLPMSKAMPISMLLFLAGMFGPGYWLGRRKTARQSLLRRGLPDVLDVMIICLEGGLSLQASIKKVADELHSAHPVLGGELRIVDREIQLGRGPGEALYNFARRSDMDEVLSLSSVIGQSEKFGASLVKSLRKHSETMREKRKQKAEELAQKAATKILFPTLLFIFPAVFVILLAPAAYQISAIFATPEQPK